MSAMIKQMVIDMVNPRLAKYPGASMMAAAILCGQAILIACGTVAYRHQSTHVKEVVMNTKSANDIATWHADPNSEVAGSEIMFGGGWQTKYWDMLGAASPSWKYFSEKMRTEDLVKAYEEGGHVKYALAVDAKYVTGDLPSVVPNKDYRAWFNHAGEFVRQYFPCQLDAVPCDQYAKLPSGKPRYHTWTIEVPWHGEHQVQCDPDLSCNNQAGLVSLTLVVKTSWSQSFVNALSFISYTELSVTALVMCLYMCATKGCCWFTNLAVLKEYGRVTMEAKTEAEMDAYHENA